jgi:hypothetical protein
MDCTLPLTRNQDLPLPPQCSIQRAPYPHLVPLSDPKPLSLVCPVGKRPILKVLALSLSEEVEECRRGNCAQFPLDWLLLHQPAYAIEQAGESMARQLGEWMKPSISVLSPFTFPSLVIPLLPLSPQLEAGDDSQLPHGY